MPSSKQVRHPRPDSRLPSAIVSAVRRRLLGWYDRHQRDLPWRRRAGDAYAQWVAEIMLQQTRVETVVNYYARFMARFPTVAALASAAHDDVLKHWEGLGYYRRILHLHRAAQQVVAEGGDIPGTAVALRRLPGIGAYTSAAIASIAFGQRAAAVDGNVARVVARLFGVQDNVLSPRGLGVVQALADQLVPPRRAGDFNQAWMDLGSAMCTPKSPKCNECPLVQVCVAAASGQTESLPIREKRQHVPRVACVVAVMVCGKSALLRQRPTGGLWSGLWEFPTAELGGGGASGRVLRELCGGFGLSSSHRPKRVGAVEHRLTHRAMTFDVYLLRATECRGPRVPVDHRWATRTEIGDLPISTAHRKILALVVDEL